MPSHATGEAVVTDAQVDAIVVSYNVKALLIQCLGSLEEARSSGALAHIIVVDNDSHDGSAKAVIQCFPEVDLIRSANVGYGAGANQGIEASGAPYVLVLNPDTVVPPATISGLSTFLDEHPDVAVAGPRMRYPDGTLQASRRRFPGRLTPVFESTIFERWWPENPWVRDYRMTGQPEGVVQTVDWLVGACLLVRREAIDRVGAFDPSFWMYGEEVEWCWRFRRHGWKIAYLPDVEIVHHEGASTSQNIARRQLAFDRSRVELQRHIHGDRVALVCAVGIQIGYLAQVVVELLKLIAGHRRAMRRQRIGEYITLIRAGIRKPHGADGQ